jgi:hypothetical protein
MKLLEQDLPSIVLYCYQNNANEGRETIRLFVSGWKMHVSPWPSIAAKSEGYIKLIDFAGDIRAMISDLQRDDQFRVSLTANLSCPITEDVISQATERLETVISSINTIHSILV